MEASKKPFRKVRKYKFPKTRLIILLRIISIAVNVNGVRFNNLNIRFNNLNSVEGGLLSREWMMEYGKQWPKLTIFS
jgi:hypothetical protein